MREPRGRGAPIGFVNLGGGLPGTYTDSIAPSRRTARAVRRALHAAPRRRLPELMVEPGRYLVGRRRRAAHRGGARLAAFARRRRRWVYLDCGKFHGLAETMDEAIRYRLRTPHDGGPTGPVVIAGPTCDSADVLYEKTTYSLPLALRDGDMVDILSAGAYTTTYAAPGFNGLPAPVEHYI